MYVSTDAYRLFQFCVNHNLLYCKNIQDDYKLCEPIPKFIGNNVTATHKLNSHRYACVQKKITFLVAPYNGVRSVFVWLLLSYH
jgi:hypothetical protein